MAKRLRKFSPPRYSDYCNYKSFLREECEHACCFCGIWESEFGGSNNFTVDHYQPQKSFPQFACNYKNLLYACADCNRFKGNYWPGKHQRRLGCYVLNPFRHDVDKHLTRDKPNWPAKTPTGIWNRIRFLLDDEYHVNKRTDRSVAESFSLSAKTTQHLIQSQLTKARDIGDAHAIRELEQELLTLESRIESINRRLTPRQDSPKRH